MTMRPEHDNLLEAMEKAEKAFEKSLNEQGLDPAYFDLETRGWLLDPYDFETLGKKIVFEAEHKSREPMPEERSYQERVEGGDT